MGSSKEFIIFIFDKTSNIEDVYENNNDAYDCLITGFTDNPGVIQGDILYFKADSDISQNSNIFFVSHNIDSLCDEFIQPNNDKTTINDTFFNHLPEEIQEEKQGKKVIIAGHWGNDSLQGYKQKCRRANQNPENIKRNIYLSYYGTQLESFITTGKKYNEIIDNQIINEILQLADLSKSPQQIKCQLINTFLPIVIDLQGLNEITDSDKRNRYSEEVKKHISDPSNKTFSQWQKIKNDIVNYVSLNNDEKNILYFEPISETADNPVETENDFKTKLSGLFKISERKVDNKYINWLNCAAKTLDAKIKQ